MRTSKAIAMTLALSVVALGAGWIGCGTDNGSSDSSGSNSKAGVSGATASGSGGSAAGAAGAPHGTAGTKTGNGAGGAGAVGSGGTASDNGGASGSGVARGGSSGSGTAKGGSSGSGAAKGGSSSAGGASSTGGTRNSDAGESGGTRTGIGGSVTDASADASPAVEAGPDATAGFTCNLILGLGSTGDWINQGGFYGMVDGTKWESITKHEQYLPKWADPNDSVWTQAFDAPDGGTVSHSCAQDEKTPSRVIFVAFASTTESAYNNYSNVDDPAVLAKWVSVLESVVATLQQKYPTVKRIELMTFIRGPGTSGPGSDCMPAASTDHEDMVMPWVDNAIAKVAQNHSQLVAAAPKFYVDDCNWFSDVGPHFYPGGKPELVAAKVAAYYSAHP